MKTILIQATKLTALSILIFGILYPLAMTGIAFVIGPNEGNGTVMKAKGKVVGFELIGQKFDADKYFNSRPSAVNYNAMATGGSNKGPSNPEYLQIVKARIDTFMVHNPGIERKDIPVDLVTASGGGLDPHISPEAAIIQIPRIARVRGIQISVLEELVKKYKEHAALGVGPSQVHVLRLNIALDSLE